MYLRQVLLLIIALAGLNNCARQIAPSGGPPDKSPPLIIKVIPENNSTLVPLDQKVEFEFNEAMDRRTLKKAVFISPDPGDGVKFKWKKRKLNIEFQDSLKTNRTYVITLGTDFKDSHNNSLKQSYTLAFATGAEISNGKISGKVFTKEKVQGILMWAYLLEGEQEPDPKERPGEYVTQTDAEGKFELTNLSKGLYRLFAIKDSDNNRFFEIGIDAIGVPAQDIELTNDSLSVSNINFKTTLQDTIGPALVSASAQDRNHLILRFDEKLLNEGIGETTNYKIHAIKSSSGDSLRIHLAFLNSLDQMEIRLITELQKPQTEYEIEINNLTDLSRNPIDLNYNKAEFIASSIPDTIKPKIISTAPADSARAVSLNSKISFNFSEVMNQNSFHNNFLIRDSLDQLLAGTFNWETPAFVYFSPTNVLESLSNYTIAVKLDSVFDLFGNTIGDSTFVSAFTTLNIDTLSSISGAVIDEDSTGLGRIYLKALQTERNGQTYEIQLAAPGPYKFTNILPGTYSIEGFRDQDNNGQYSYGSAVPFRPAERFLVSPNTIKVRARWPNDGNDITFTK